MIRYAPGFILLHYLQNELSGSFTGFVLLVDLADFTPVSTKFQKHGKQGAEELSAYLELAFGEPIRIVESCGGFVSLFAGDAFCAVFPDPEEGRGETAPRLQPILDAALRIRRFFEDKRSYRCALGEFPLKARQALSYGEINWQIFENELQNEYVFQGQPLNALAGLSAWKRELVLSLSAAERIGIDSFIPLEADAFIPAPSLLNQRQDQAELAGPVTFAARSDLDHQSALAHFINPKYRDLGIQPEIRSAAFCFANLKAIPTEERKSAVSILQELADSYGGFVNKYDATDKGLIALILFGIPFSEGRTLERACRFALEAVGQIPSLAVGLAKGNVYAGFSGSGEVKEYTALGHPLNLAARLMSIAGSSVVITDSYLCQELSGLFLFEVQTEVVLKGIAEPIMSYRLKDYATRSKLTAQYGFVGREKEIVELRQVLDEAISHGKNLAVYVYGDPGIGKSRLIQELLDFYPDESYQKYYIYCDSILPKSLEPLKQLLRHYFPANQHQGQQEKIALFRNKWKLLAKDDIELIRIESILAALLGCEWERSVWDMLPPAEKPQQIKNAFLRFMSELARQKPVLIHLDDAQWIDEMSKDYFQALSEKEIRPVQIVSSCRYLADGGKPELGLEKHTAVSKDLGILDEEGSRALIRNILKQEDIPQYTFDEINARAMGNPFFIEQLCAYLLEIGKMDSEGRITGELGAVAAFSISDVIGSRIDRLTERVRECVYNASVLGMEFNVRVLSRMLANPLAQELEEGRSNLIWRELGELRYIFSHILIKDVAYLRILESRLKTLHHLAAEAMENIFGDALDEHAEEIALHFEKSGLEVKAAVYYDKAGCWYYKNYDFSKSRLYLNNALRIRERVMGADHPDTAASLNNLANVFLAKGEFSLAEPLFLRALTIREKVMAAEHPDTAASLNNLAGLYQNQGRYEQAENLYLQALTIREKVLGMEHRDTAGSLNNLANVYRATGRYGLAEALCLRAVANMEMALGAEHPVLAGALYSLAVLYDDQGRYGQAEPLYLRALAIREKVLGPEHPDTARSLEGLAALCWVQNRYEQAEPLYLRALTIKEKVLGREHHSTAYSLNALAALYNDQGRYEHAESFYRRTLAIWEQTLGLEHPETAKVLSNMADLKMAQGKFEEAEPMLLRALAIGEKAFGVDHPGMASLLSNLASLYHIKQMYDQAEPLYLRALAIKEKALGPEHPDLASTLNNLAELYMDQGRFEQAEPLFLRALEIREKALGMKHVRTISLIRNITRLYEMKGQSGKAAHYKAMLPEADKAQE
jgi:tetratricopeptide (TPR) repeat protein/class 3 adenylate cyclase